MYVHVGDPETSRLTQAIRLRRQRQDRARPRGLHLSRITDDWIKTAYPEKYRGVFTEEQRAGYQEIGNAFESLVARELRALYVGWHKPDPKRRDGIICSPDGISPRTRTLDEMKATWVSSRDFLIVDDRGRPLHKSIKFLSYEIRILGYLYAWGYTRARLWVWFVNGAYPKGPPAPEWPHVYVLRYTRKEICHWWRRIKLHAEDRGWR